MRARYLVCYDIASPRRLRRVAKLMLSLGERVQKSVFECELSPQERESLERQARQILDPKQDSLRFYRLCPRCSRSRQLIGTGEVPQPRSTLIS